MIIAALQRNPLFVTAALPLHVVPPLFNRYAGGQTYGNHVDNAVRQVPGAANRIRTDVSCTLFLTPPEEYDGGELVVEDVYGAHSVKLPAGHMVLYPSTSLHRVRPVTRGRARQLVLLGPEHGPRRLRSPPAVRSRPGGARACRRTPRPPRCRPADGRVP